MLEVLKVAYALAGWIPTAFIFLNLFRKMAVPGTRARYIYAGYQHMIKWPSLTMPVLWTIQHSLEHAPLSVGLDIFILWVIWRDIQELKKDGDDNWWDKGKKGLKKWLKKTARKVSKVRVKLPDLSPAPSPV